MGGFGLFCDLGKDRALPLGPFVIPAGRITDPGVSHRLDTVQGMLAGGGDMLGLGVQNLVGVADVFVQVAQLFLAADVDGNAAQNVDGFGDGAEITGGVIVNGQIQALLQHGIGAFHPAIGVGSIRFFKVDGIFVRGHIQKCVAVDRYDFDILGIIVNGEEHDHVAPSFVLAVPVVHAVKGNGGMAGVGRAVFFLGAG